MKLTGYNGHPLSFLEYFLFKPVSAQVGERRRRDVYLVRDAQVVRPILLNIPTCSFTCTLFVHAALLLNALLLKLFRGVIYDVSCSWVIRTIIWKIRKINPHSHVCQYKKFPHEKTMRKNPTVEKGSACKISNENFFIRKIPTPTNLQIEWLYL